MPNKEETKSNEPMVDLDTSGPGARVELPEPEKEAVANSGPHSPRRAQEPTSRASLQQRSTLRSRTRQTSSSAVKAEGRS